MKKFLAFLFVGLILSVSAQSVTTGLMTELKPGIEFMQGQIMEPVYDVVSESPAVCFVYECNIPVRIQDPSMEMTLYGDCRKMVTGLRSDLLFPPGAFRPASFYLTHKSSYSSISKDLPPGCLSHESNLKDLRVAKQRAVLNRKFPG